MVPSAAVTRDDGWYTGEDKILTFRIWASGTTQAAIDAGTATRQDISGYALSYRLKRLVDDPDSRALITKTTSAGITITDGPNGVCQVTILDTDTDRLPGGWYVHELKRTDAGFESVLTSDPHGAAAPAYLQPGVHRS